MADGNAARVARPSGARRAMVMGAGLTTTVVTLVLFWHLEALDIMRHYTAFVPTGALGLGIMAGSGYGLAGWLLTDLKFTVRSLVFIGLSMVVCYWLLEALEYAKYAAPGVGFFDYYDAATRSSVVATSYGESDTVGPAGYNFRLLELVGLTVGGLLGCALPLLRRS